MFLFLIIVLETLLSLHHPLFRLNSFRNIVVIKYRLNTGLETVFKINLQIILNLIRAYT